MCLIVVCVRVVVVVSFQVCCETVVRKILNFRVSRTHGVGTVRRGESMSALMGGNTRGQFVKIKNVYVYPSAEILDTY